MIKISAVSYLNAIPFIYAIRESDMLSNVDLNLDYPSVCADKLISGQVDLALVPVVVISSLKESYIISEYCIGANGPVDTVCLYSDVPINKIKNILLDYQSKTSVALLKILLKEYWMISPELKIANEGFEKEISGDQAALVIGDRAFNLNKRYQYIYDLSAIWTEMTGLPFVFAAWIANTKLPKDFITVFNKELAKGLSNIDKALMQYSNNDYPYCDDPKDYLNNKISYSLDSRKLEGMRLFLKKIII